MIPAFALVKSRGANAWTDQDNFSCAVLLDICLFILMYTCNQA